MNPNRYDIWDVNSAASGLTGQAMVVSNRHIDDGMSCMQFNREVAYYAKRIVDDVTLGHKTPEQGIQALLQEQRDLLNQSLALARTGTISHAVKRIPLMRLTQPVYRADPERLLRYVHAQDLKSQQKAQHPTYINWHRDGGFCLEPRERQKCVTRDRGVASTQLFT